MNSPPPNLEQAHSQYMANLCTDMMIWGFLYSTLLDCTAHGPLLVCSLYSDEEHAGKD